MSHHPPDPKMEKKLKETQRTLSMLMRHLPGMVYRCRLDPRRTMEFVSEGCSGLTGYIPSALIRNRLVAYSNMIHPDDREMVLEKIQHTLQDKRAFSLEYRIRTASGSQKWVWDKGVGLFAPEEGPPTAVEGFLIDITEQKEDQHELRHHRDHLEELVAERTRELRQSEEKYKTLYNSSMDAIMMLTPHKGFFDANPATLKLFGYTSREEFNARAPEELSPPFQPDGRKSSEKSWEIMELALKNGAHSFEWLHKRLDGTEFMASVVLNRLQLYGQEMLQATVRDITQQKKAEEALRFEMTQRKQVDDQLKILVTDLERANKELEYFAYIVSHDLKAPLRGISSLVNWISEDYSENMDKNGREYLDKLHNRTVRMHHLIDGILQYSRIGRIKIETRTIQCAPLVQDIIDSLHIPPDKTVQIKGSLPTVVYDRIHLTQVFQNLIGNAIEHMEKPQGKVTVSGKSRKYEWEFCVEDNGVGIEEKHFERIFKIFQSLKRSPQSNSTGIGLALVKKIVEQNGGAVWVESVVNKGCSFHFTIPRKTQTDASHPATTILIVDDNREFINVAASMLKRKGYNVLWAADGAEAYQLYKAYGDGIHTALMDIHIPGEDPLENYVALRKLSPRMKIIACTGTDSDLVDVATIKLLQREGLDGVVGKPFKMAELAPILERPLDEPLPPEEEQSPKK